MKITKYPQSCVMIETNHKKILVDPGILKYKEEYFDEWNKADIILITHRHGDHCNSDVIKEIKNVPIYSCAEVKNFFPELDINIVKENDSFDFDGIKINVTKAIHGYNPLLKVGKEIFESVGYIVDSGDKKVYITSDTICFNNDYKADIMICPITAHGLTMSSYEASLLAGEIEAELVLPVHMDNETYPPDFNYMKEMFAKYNVNYRVLEIEESIEI